MPLFILVVLTVLMIQLQNVSRVVMVLLTAPLGLIGVTLFLLLFGKPFGFVAMLGTIALSGMIMRNSVILVDQIQQDIAAGRSEWDAIVESTVRRFRPIVLTAAGGAGDDSVIAQRLFRTHGGRDHGGIDGRDPADPAVSAGAVCRLVSGQAGRADGRLKIKVNWRLEFPKPSDRLAPTSTGPT